LSIEAIRVMLVMVFGRPTKKSEKNEKDKKRLNSVSIC